MKKVSIKDVASLANVSIASVSYVLNKMPNSRISDSTASRIRLAAETLNYRPNKIAKSLKTNRSKILGFIVADIANPFFGQIAKIMEEEAMKIGYTLIVGSSGENEEKFDNLIDLFLEQQVDGLILAPVENSDESLKKLQKQMFPYIVLDRYLDSDISSGVQIDNREISFDAISYLINQGAKNPLLVSYETTLLNLLDRNVGFFEAVEKLKINAIKPIKVRTDYIQKDVTEGLKQRFSESIKPDAIYFTSNKLAFSGLRYLLKTKINIPDDVQVIAFDESEAYELFPVEVSYIKQPLDEIGKNALEMILNKVNEETTDKKIVKLSANLVLKESTR